MKSKPLIIFVMIAVLTGCGNTGEDLQSKKKKLEEMKKEMEKLEFGITELEKEIATLDTSTTEALRGRLVTVKKPELTHFQHYIEIQGNATSDENVTISAEMGGEVKDIPVTEGQKVAKGQILIRLDDEIIRKEIDELKVGLELATTVYERQKNLWEQNIGSEIQFLQAKNKKESLEKNLVKANAQLEKTRIKSPINGTVDDIMVKIGEMAKPGYPLISVVNLNKIVVKADAPETYITSIHKGEEAMVRFPAIGVEKTGTISSVGKVVNPVNRTFQVEIKLPNKDNTLKANLLAIIQVVDYENDSALVIPTRIIQFADKQQYVYVAVQGEEGKFHAKKTEITTGKTYRGETEVLSGLSANDVLIDEGGRDVSDGEAIIIKQGL